MEWEHFAENAELAHAARDELRVLRAEVEDEDQFAGHGLSA